MIEPIAKLMGYILDILYKGLDAIGIGNVAIAIVVFTLIVKMLMLPLTIKQQKMTKLQSVINPEIKVIQEKYKGKNSDANAMANMQAETKEVYDKYGVSQWGSCIQLLIQMPILLALYRVFQSIPLYISQIKVLFLNILGNNGVDGITSDPDYADKLNDIVGKTIDWANTDTAIKTINSFSSSQWEQLKESFPAFSDIITQNYDKLTDVNTFLGVNMSQNPGFGMNIAVLIPILAFVSQFISVKVSQSGTQMDEDNPAAASMKMMTLFMPLMSAFIAVGVPAGLGLYWIATAVIQTIMFICINHYYDKLGTEAIIKKNIEKRDKKIQKKGVPSQTIVKGASINTRKVESQEERIKRLQSIKEENEKKVKEIRDAASSKSAKSGSIAAKANLAAKYNDKNDKRK